METIKTKHYFIFMIDHLYFNFLPSNKLELRHLPLGHEHHRIQNLLGNECDSTPFAAEDV